MSSSNVLAAADRELLKLIATVEHELPPRLDAVSLPRFTDHLAELKRVTPHAEHPRLIQRAADLSVLLADDPVFQDDLRATTTRDPAFLVPLAAAARAGRGVSGAAAGVWVGAQRPAMAPAAWALAERELKDLVGLRAPPVVPIAARGPLGVPYRPLAKDSQLQAVIRLDLPAVLITPVPLPLKAVAEDAVRDLEPYARTLDGFEHVEFNMRAARLPPELFEIWMGRPAGRQLHRCVATLREQSPHTMQELLNALLPGTERPDRRHILLISELLQRFAVGFEPDPRFQAALARPETPITLFDWHSTELKPSGAFVTAAAVMHIGLAMAAADGHIDPVEVTHVRERAMRLVTDSDERTRLAVRMDELILDPPKFEPLLLRLKGIRPAAKEIIADLLVGVASTDGDVSQAEYEALLRAYRAMRLGKPLLDRTLEQLRGQVRLVNTIGADGDRRSDLGQQQDAKRFDALRELLGTPASAAAG